VEGFERSLFNGEPKARRRAPKLNLNQLKLDFARAEHEQQQRRNTWREILLLASPDRYDLEKQAPGTNNHGYSTDSSPIGAARRGAGNLKASIVPNDATWVELEAGAEIPDEHRDQASEIFEKIRDVAFDELANSSYDAEADSMAEDIMISMGHMVIDPGTPEHPLMCRAVPLSQTFPVEGIDGEVSSVFRKYELPVSDVLKLWPTATLPQEWVSKAEKDQNAPVCVVEGNIQEVGYGYRFVVLTEDCKTVVHEVEPDDPDEPSRSITPRIRRSPGGVYGSGPLVEALPDMRVLSKLKENYLRAQAKALTPGGLIDGAAGLNPNTMRTGPNAWNIVSSASGLRPADMISAFPMDLNALQLADVEISNLRRQIEKILFAEPLLPPVESSHQMTAYEVQARRLQQIAERGVELGRVEKEWALATIRRVVWCLQKVGKLPAEITPGVRLNLDNRLVRVRYSGPLAQARDAATASNVLQTVGDVRAAVGDETAATAMRLEDVPRVIAELRNVPAKLLRSDADIQKLQEAKAQAAQQQMAAQQQQAEAGQGPAV
jgi:hypothetical protein